MSRSILLMTRTGRSLSFHACRRTEIVCEMRATDESVGLLGEGHWRRARRTCVQTPSTASTRTSAPSHSLEAVETSLEKSTWPGVSISCGQVVWVRQQLSQGIRTDMAGQTYVDDEVLRHDLCGRQ
jgi:hypothetical protein